LPVTGIFHKWTPHTYTDMVGGKEEEEDAAAMLDHHSQLDQPKVMISQVCFSYENVTIG